MEPMEKVFLDVPEDKVGVLTEKAIYKKRKNDKPTKPRLWQGVDGVFYTI